MTFNVKPGLKYSDGSPLNAARYKFSIMRNIDPATAGEYAAITDEIKGAPGWRGFADDPKKSAEENAKAKAAAKAVVDTEGITLFKSDGKTACAPKLADAYKEADCTVLKLKFAYPVDYDVKDLAGKPKPAPERAEDDFKPSGQREQEEAIKLRNTWRSVDGMYEDTKGNLYSGDPALKVTLAWDDPPGTPNVSPALVNDLDLVVFDPGNVQIFPWTLGGLANPAAPAVRTQRNSLDNLEQYSGEGVSLPVEIDHLLSRIDILREVASISML